MENKVKECRTAKRWTQDRLSEESGVPRTTISEIEDGRRTPGVDTAILLARALATTVEELFIV